ncbi:MAG: hypothetical protein NT062_29155 [Proteobacteria bacterium]|nr:hypothetical protein [Pseudomonadota bacterium]
MHAHGSRWIGLAVLGIASVALATPPEPKPAIVDIKPIKDKALVFVDAKGGAYVVVNEPGHNVIYFGTSKTLYQQRMESASRNGDAWSISAWAPRLSELRGGSVERLADGTYRRWCDGKDDAALTLVTGDKAKKVLDTAQFLTPALVRTPFLFARDDTGVYYYVDAIRDQPDPMVTAKYRAHRVFVGKKGAMKLVTLTDVASDSMGVVLSSKTGDLRLVKTTGKEDSVVWIKGGKRNELVMLNVDVNSVLIFSELGIYTFIGTLCDNA